MLSLARKVSTPVATRLAVRATSTLVTKPILSTTPRRIQNRSYSNDLSNAAAEKVKLKTRAGTSICISRNSVYS